MNALCLDILNTDWHDYRGTRRDEDRLLRPEWVEQILKQWSLESDDPADEQNIAALQNLRVLMWRMVQAILEKQPLAEQDIALLNSYFDASPSRPQLIDKGEKGFQLRQLPLKKDWHWVLSEVARSFATLLADYDLSRIKLCENPDCRWIYYDESANQTRRWCEPPCANLMRIRRFRTRHHEKIDR